MRTDAEEKFIAWLVTQPNTRGSLYLERVARQYANYLRIAPTKLKLPLSDAERDVYACETINQFLQLQDMLRTAPNYKAVNEMGHQTFSAGLAAYKRYLESLVEQDENIKLDRGESEPMVQTATASAEIPNANIRRVDFNHPELCSECDPVSCIVEGNDYSGGNWRDVLVSLTEAFLQSKPKAAELYHKSLYPHGERVFLLKCKPKMSARQLTNGYWVNVNLSIKDLVFTIGKLCEFCGVDLRNVSITYSPKKFARGVRPMDKITGDSAWFAQQTIRDAFREWLTLHNPKWSNATVTMHCSDAYYLYNNKRGITLKEALTADDGLQRAYDAIERFYMENPTQRNSPSGSARGYLRSLRMLKEFLDGDYHKLLSASLSPVSATIVPETVVDALSKNYATGFRFETTAIRLLSDRTGIEIDATLQNALKRSMFCRKDDVYFLLDNIADAETRQDIISSADCWLDDYGCFELSELYTLFADKVNSDCIGDVDDFEALYEYINKRDVRCVAYYGTRIARIQKSIPDLSADIAKTIIAATRDELGGVIDEDELKSRFAAFSDELLSKIIRQHAEELVKTEINGIVCFQTLDTLGLSDDFSETLSEVLSRIGELDLTPSQEVLNTALSLQLGVNFRNEYSIPDDQTFRRIITMYHKAEPRHEWKGGIFAEVSN